MIKGLLIIIFYCIYSLAEAQTTKSLCLIYNDNVDKEDHIFCGDSLSIRNYINKIVLKAFRDGYLEASIDSFIRLNDSTFTANLFRGKQYKWGNLSWDSSDPVFRKPGNWDDKFEGKRISPLKLGKELENVLSSATDKGYPFAKLWLDNIEIDGDILNASLKTSRGPYFEFDDITIEGEKLVSDKSYWYGVLDIKKGGAFSFKTASEIDKTIKELPFVESVQPAEIYFKEDKASFKLYLKKKKSNHFDIILGIQPASTTGQGSSKLVVTGQITADMYNLLQGGEHILFDYKKFRAEDQNLLLGIQWPYLFKTRIGADGQFLLQKRDTNFIDINYSIGAVLPVNRNLVLKVIAQQAVSNILSFNKQNLIESRKLPNILDYTRSSFGVEVNYSRLDYLLSPSQGWNLGLRLIAGTRVIKKNQKILSLSNDDVNFSNQYDSIGLKNSQYRIEFIFDKYTKLFPRNVFKTSLSGGNIFGNSLPLENELYRLGGFKVLRGFDEQSVLVSRYLLATVEYRFLIGALSYVFLFSDVAFTQSKYGEVNYNDQPVSIGLGLTLETKAGVLGISTAVGQRKNSPFDWRAPKIHFGYVNFF